MIGLGPRLRGGDCKALYEILLGQSEGPRMGSFFALYGLDESLELIERAIRGEDLAA